MEPPTKKRKLDIKESSISIIHQVPSDPNHQKIVYHDHTYAKNRTITMGEINDDCLGEIFICVPACERPKLALVCKQWKRAFQQSLYKIKSLSMIYWRYDEYPNCLAQYSTIDKKFSYLRFILNKFGRYLTTLDLTAYDNCNILPVINELCPKIVTLRLRFTTMDKKTLVNSFTRLSKLKSLTIIFKNMSFPLSLIRALFKSLRNVRSTLTELNMLNLIDHFSEPKPDLTKLIIDEIEYLTGLKKFEVAGIEILKDFEPDMIDNEILFFNHTVFLQIHLRMDCPLSRICDLRITRCRVKNETLYSIANTMEFLKLLRLDTNWITDDGIVAISKMNRLESLDITGSAKISNSAVSLLKKFKTIALPASKYVSDDGLISILENSPELESMSVFGIDATIKFIKKAAEISKIRKKILILFVVNMEGIEQYKSTYLKIFPFEKIRKERQIRKEEI